MAGGVGAGIRFYLGEFLVQDASQNGATFVGSAATSHIRSWEANKIVVNVDELDVAPGKALPAGFTALTAVEAHLLLRMEWARPLFEAHFPLAVKA
jgi:hypothetical protein